jgi:hypothetical protein
MAPVRTLTLAMPAVLAGTLLLQQRPVLSAASLYDLHDSADRVRIRLDLSKEEFAVLDHALDVMVGDQARRLMERLDAVPRRLPAPIRLAAEARVLAPVEGLTYEGLVTAAVDKTRDRRTGLLGDLRYERAAAPTSRRELQRIEVVEASYWSRVVTGERGVDFTVRNDTEEMVTALLLDCRLIDTDRRQTRERGTCRIDFDQALAPGSAATATAAVSWEARQRLGWVVEARPIRAYGAGGEELWEVASELDSRECGRLAQLESRIAELDSDLESLDADPRSVR